MVPVHEGRVNDHPLAAVEERSQLVHPSPLPMVPIISYNSQHSIDLSEPLKKYINKYISQVNYVPTCYRNKKSAVYAHTHIHSNKENVSWWCIIPEELSWALHLRLTRTRETATFGISFQESFPEEKEQARPWT